MSAFVDASPYSARVLEIVLHSLFQVLDDRGELAGPLKPLSQMRSANKKHGNIGDVEVMVGRGALEILEAWDAKYGKPYLRDELEELSEKLYDHAETKLVGFVVDRPPDLKQEIKSRVREIEVLHEVEIQIMRFEDWAEQQLARGVSRDEMAQEWLLAFAESLCQRRRERAPIDEPSDAWVRLVRDFAQEWVHRQALF